MRYEMSVLLAFVLLASTAFGQETLQVVAVGKLQGPAAHGMKKLSEAIAARNIGLTTVDRLDQANSGRRIVAGLASQPAVAKLITAGGLPLPEQPEALAIRRIEKGDRTTVVICGADPVGLMYAALDTAERIGWAATGQDVFAHIRDRSESPFLTDRNISTYTMQRRWFEQRLYDRSYWERYFDMLAASRINSFVIVFGYENGGFMAPIYPYFFDVEEFPNVELHGMTDQEQAKNTAALTHVIDLAHQRGIRFTVGIWDHIYRGGVQGGGIAGASDLVGKKTPHLVYGVTTENLALYTKAALKKLLAVFPSIDAIQFRMHWESGLTRQETPRFWHDVFSMLRELQPDIGLDLRAKGLPDEVIEDAIAQGLSFRIGTKHWMEQLGLPFHPTHVNPPNQKDRRHGYADLLRFPKQYEMHWRIWSGGTARFLLWGDPEFVRRFVESARVYDGKSFEVNEMLATKMLGEPHDAEPFQLLTPAYRHYQYEFERYWHYYQVWGRVSYNPAAERELWEREFSRRFGVEAGPRVMKALHQASWILPRIVAASYNYQYFPTTRGWAEMMRLGDLPQYAEGTGTDVEQFQSYKDAAQQLLSGEFTAKRTPFHTSDWFTSIADEVLAGVESATAAAHDPKGPAAQEFHATITDLRILAHLARYHAARMKAAVWYNVYLETKDRWALQHCLADESNAIDQWRKVIASAGDVYPETLKFGVHRVGFSWHWKEELGKLEEGLAKLRELPSENRLDAETRQRIAGRARRSSAAPLLISVERAKLAKPGQDLTISASTKPPSDLQWMRLRYRHLTQFEDYESAAMTYNAVSDQYETAIPGSFIVPEWDLMYFVEAVDKKGSGRMVPDMDQEMPYVIVPVQR